MKYFIPVLLMLASCSYLIVEQTNEDRIYEKSERIRKEYKKEVLINPELFDSLVYYADTIKEIPKNLLPKENSFGGPLIESPLNIIGYGLIKHGELIHAGENKNVIEIIDSLLFISISDGCGYIKGAENNCNLIWDGKYYSDKEELYVELVFSYVNPCIRSLINTKSLQFDLSTLKHPDKKKVKIVIYGYVYDLYYTY